jgi:hypothetical protein
MKKLLVIAIILGLGGASTIIALTYKMWGTGIFPGTLEVIAHKKTPIADGSVTDELVTIGVKSGDQRVGQSGTEIQLTSGQHAISFEDYSAEYQSPQSQTVFIKPYETTYLNIDYLARFGYLIVCTQRHNAYNETSKSIYAEVFVDGQRIGFSNESYSAGRGYYISCKLNASESSHVVFFSGIEGYTRPQNKTVTMGNAQVVEMTGVYEELLTSEQEIYVFCRTQIRRYAPVLNATSNLDTDRFKQWIRNERITSPKYYFCKQSQTDGERWYGSCDAKYIVARYGGIYEADQIQATEDIFYRLNSCGIDLRSKGSISKVHYKDESEYIIVAEFSFDLRYENVEGKIYKFKEADIDNLPNLSTKIGIGGIGFAFSDAREVYVTTGSTTVPFEERYAPPFREYTNLDELGAHTKGWCWKTEWGGGYSYDPRELFRSFRIEKYG